MHFQYNTFTLPPLIAAGISTVVTIYAGRLRARRAAAALSILGMAAAIWSFGYALEIAGADLATKAFWGQIQYFGITAVPLGWLAFALQYSGRDRMLTRRNLIILAALPVATLLLTLTNDLHHLIWQSIDLNTSGPFVVLDVTHGIAFWVYWVYSQILILSGVVLVFRTLLSAERLYRRQAVVLIVAVLTPWIGNILYILDLSPIDLTPLAFSASAAAIALGLFQLRLLYLAPIAREAVVEDMSDAMIVIDPQGYTVDLNPAAEQLIGLPASQIVGQPIDKVLKDWPALFDRNRELSTVRTELSIGHVPDSRLYELRVSELQNRGGIATERVITLRDITERKRAEQALARQTARLATLNQLSHEIVATLDTDQVYSAAHHAVEQLMLIEAFFIALFDEEQQTIEDVYLFDRDQRWPNERTALGERRLIAEILCTGESLWLKDTAADPSSANSYVPFGSLEISRSVISVPLKSGGRTIGVMSAQHYQPNIYTQTDLDILATLANQVATAIDNARLVQSLRLQAAALDATANAMVMTDRNGLVRWTNPAFTTLTGYTAEEISGQTLRLLKSGQHTQAFYRQLWDTITAGRTWQGELYNRRKDGSLYVEEQTITPIRNEQGEIFRFIAVKQDVTELITTRDTALEMNRLKTQLLTRVSHDLRTPLGAILGYAELMDYGSFGSLTEQQKKILAEIMSSVNDLIELVNELLDEAQLEARVIKLEIEPFMPRALLNKVETSMAVLARNKGLTLTGTISSDLPAVLMGDEARLQQVLINLIGNAIKFTEAGDVKVHFDVHDSTSWAIAVSDTGPGIAKEAQDYIFEPFRRIENSAGHHQRGTGLGLSIAKHLTQLMGGKITLDSDLGLGSTFTLILPQVEVLQQADL
jgi:PAS domain S-box-containing protein